MDHNPEFITVAALASFAIHPLGHDVEIGFADAEDRLIIVKLHPNVLASLFALIPQILDRALERLSSNAGAKQVFGLDGWQVDVVNGGSASVLTLCGAGGFKVSFLVDADSVGHLAQALHQGSGEEKPHIAGISKH
jgi:hypothetical protein